MLKELKKIYKKKLFEKQNLLYRNKKLVALKTYICIDERLLAAKSNTSE